MARPGVFFLRTREGTSAISVNQNNLAPFH
jgi:hypothetical protein